MALKPWNASHNKACVVAYGGLLALQYLEKGNFQQAKRLLIYGASGSCETTAVQIAKHYDAHITAACSGANFKLVKSLSADVCIDYTTKNTLPKGETFDLVLDAVGRIKSSPLKLVCKKALNPNGKDISIDDGDLQLDSKQLDKLRSLANQEAFTPIIDRSYPLESIIEAHRYVEQGHKKGSVIITVI